MEAVAPSKMLVAPKLMAYLFDPHQVTLVFQQDSQHLHRLRSHVDGLALVPKFEPLYI